MNDNSNQNSNTGNNFNQTYTINYTVDVQVYQLHNPIPEFGGIFGPLMHTHELSGQLTWQEIITNHDQLNH